MKKTILLLFCLCTMLGAYAQEIPTEQPKELSSRESYLQKSKKQKTAAIVMLAGGGALAIVAMAIEMNDFEDDLGNLLTTNYDNNEGNDGATLTLFIVGVGSMLGSIPMFVSAKKNKRKALSISFKNEVAPALQRTIVNYRPVPSLSLKIKL